MPPSFLMVLGLIVRGLPLARGRRRPVQGLAERGGDLRLDPEACQFPATEGCPEGSSPSAAPAMVAGTKPKRSSSPARWAGRNKPLADFYDDVDVLHGCSRYSARTTHPGGRPRTGRVSRRRTLRRRLPWPCRHTRRCRGGRAGPPAGSPRAAEARPVTFAMAARVPVATRLIGSGGHCACGRSYLLQ